MRQGCSLSLAVFVLVFDRAMRAYMVEAGDWLRDGDGDAR